MTQKHLWVQPLHRLNFSFDPPWEEVRNVFFEAPDDSENPRARWEEAWVAAYVQIADWFIHTSGKMDFWTLSEDERKKQHIAFWKMPQDVRIEWAENHPHLSWSSVMPRGYPIKVADCQRYILDKYARGTRVTCPAGQEWRFGLLTGGRRPCKCGRAKLAVRWKRTPDDLVHGRLGQLSFVCEAVLDWDENGSCWRMDQYVRCTDTTADS